MEIKQEYLCSFRLLKFSLDLGSRFKPTKSLMLKVHAGEGQNKDF